MSGEMTIEAEETEERKDDKDESRHKYSRTRDAMRQAVAYRGHPKRKERSPRHFGARARRPLQISPDGRRERDL
jgi:hypothetical protein